MAFGQLDSDPFCAQEHAESLAGNGLLLLASDCLGANKPGYTRGEAHIEESIYKIVSSANRSVFFTAISSNIGRFQQAINVAERCGRKVLLIGRSIQKKCEIAYNLGYLNYKSDTVISISDSHNLPPEKLMFLISGCYGQVGSSLYRLSLQEHEKIEIQKGDTLIFSADPAPPYTKESEDYVIDNFIGMGVDVHYYDLNEELYISGHGSQEDIMELFRIANPRYFIPIGGAIRFMHAYKKLAVAYGADPQNVFELRPGESVIFENGRARRGEKIDVKAVLVHGLGIGDVGRIILSDREILGKEGVVVVVIKVGVKDKRLVEHPEIITRGFIFEKLQKKLLRSGSDRLEKTLKEIDKYDKDKIKRSSIDLLERFFFKETGRHPMILPIIVEV